MRRSAILGLVLTGLIGGSGCHSTCSNRSGLFSRCTNRPDNCAQVAACPTAGPPGCPQGMPASLSRPGAPVVPPGGFGLDGAMPGFPTYPSGEPIPVNPGTASPPNELPMPNIPPQNVPPFASPTPAIPMSAATLPMPSVRMTGESKSPK
jgi:hypothetical protein